MFFFQQSNSSHKINSEIRNSPLTRQFPQASRAGSGTSRTASCTNGPTSWSRRRAVRNGRRRRRRWRPASAAASKCVSASTPPPSSCSWPSCAPAVWRRGRPTSPAIPTASCSCCPTGARRANGGRGRWPVRFLA